MKLQEYIIETTGKAAREVFRYAKSVPVERVEWKPLDEGRSVLELVRELAKTPDWAYETIFGKTEPEWDEDTFAAQKAEMETWKTVEECEAQCLTRLERFFEAVRQMPDEDLSLTKWLPYHGGGDVSYAEMLEYPRWNFNYHLGQICYIQILYGDREMH